jgi:hypothetical protein
VTVAAPMLEKLDDRNSIGSSVEPQIFSDTTDTLTNTLPVCEDITGEIFRAKRWSRGCVKLCPDGYSSECAERAETHCYWETSFHLNQRAIEAGAMFNNGGFARGNFNYRIEQLGLNFVGTGMRSCENENLPSTCFGGGYVPYSLRHDGPYFVRNHLGKDYRARLFTGNIEHARGLGAERYVTNPMSDADRSLLESYMRSEFQGRPLDGMYVLRVWDETGVNFDAIQDVQLVLNYRYWTRFD